MWDEIAGCLQNRDFYAGKRPHIKKLIENTIFMNFLPKVAMSLKLQNRIAKAIRELYNRGVKANLIILGRSELPLLKGSDPEEVTFAGCKYMIDEKSKSRCDAYGQYSNHYLTPETYEKQLSAKKQQLRKHSVQSGDNPVHDSIMNESSPPSSIYKQIILEAGWVDTSYRNRHKEPVEEYKLKFGPFRNDIILRKVKEGIWKLYRSYNEDKCYQGPITTLQQLENLTKKVYKL